MNDDAMPPELHNCRCDPGQHGVELVGGLLDGEVVHWRDDWSDVEWFGGAAIAYRADPVFPSGAFRATRIGPKLLPRLVFHNTALVLYQRSPSGLLAMFRDIHPGSATPPGAAA